MSFRAVSTADLLANKLREMINNGVERDLASHFDVSRIPMREAIRQLEHEGLVEIFRNRGAIVRTLSVDDLNEIYQLRSLLEGEAIFQSVNNLSADNLARAGLTHSLLASCTKFERQGQLNREFHDLLYSGCENHRLLTMINDSRNQIERYEYLQRKLLSETSLFQDKGGDCRERKADECFKGC